MEFKGNHSVITPEGVFIIGRSLPLSCKKLLYACISASAAIQV